MKLILRILVVLVFLFSIGLYRLNELNKVPVKVENFSTYNLAEIYALGAVMSALAYPIYPEIAIEHMALYFKKKSKSKSDFFMSSKVVQKAIKQYTKPTMLVWDSKAYMFGNSEARVALALNGAILTKNKNQITIEVPIKYPRYAVAKLLPGIKINEGLFWVLQEKGWYHTGVMTWTHNL